jgi:hypothetical protein
MAEWAKTSFQLEKNFSLMDLFQKGILFLFNPNSNNKILETVHIDLHNWPKGYVCLTKKLDFEVF